MEEYGGRLVDTEMRSVEVIKPAEQQRRRRGAARAAADERERRSRLQSFQLAKAELERQSTLTSHPARREQLALAIAEVERRLAEV